MPTPEFIIRLREKIGHDPLWLIGVTGYIEDDRGRVLLGRRSDTGRWALVSGINEPGEQPAETIVREALEETGVAIEPDELVSVVADPRMITYANGDKVQYLELLFCCHAKAGAEAARVGDEESLEVGWFYRGELPQDLSETTRERMALVDEYRARLRHGDAHCLFRS
ncbi:NUDIX hydrolase [Collinsella tanakaei]|uniref:NUDIX hydrolase n=1 Tax=Collinsella tanakaei TaxID=626935 RepID=UPI00195DB6A9|nr:NUDIX domain-containing protein [Collinsella tanakaei]MBM6867632.1 NUDIX domain-containing protein [Collinsella tanakaei]